MEKKSALKKLKKPAIVVSKKPEVLSDETDAKAGYVTVQKLNGQRDRISVSIGMDIEITQYKFKVKPYFNYSSDVGMYDENETLEQAIERVQGVATDVINEMKNQAIQERKRQNQKEST